MGGGVSDGEGEACEWVCRGREEEFAIDLATIESRGPTGRSVVRWITGRTIRAGAAGKKPCMLL